MERMNVVSLLVLGMGVFFMMSPMVEGSKTVVLPSLVSSLGYSAAAGSLSVVIFAVSNSSEPIAEYTVDIGFPLSTGLQAKDFVATYDPTTQAFNVWISNSYFFEIGALNGVVLSTGSTPRVQLNAVAACPSLFNNAVLSITPGSLSYAFTANIINDQGGPSTSRSFASASGSSVATLSPLCAVSSIEPALFYPFSYAAYLPNLYLVTNQSTNALAVNSDHMTLINGLTTLVGPFDGQQEATRAIYVLGLQTSIPVKVVTVTNNQPTTITLPLTIPNYQTQYIFSNQILKSVAAFVPKTSTYIFPLLNFSASTIAFMIGTITQTPTSAVVFETSPYFQANNLLLAIAAFQ